MKRQPHANDAARPEEYERRAVGFFDEALMDGGAE
jgi:hypothetical protein